MSTITVQSPIKVAAPRGAALAAAVVMAALRWLQAMQSACASRRLQAERAA